MTNVADILVIAATTHELTDSNEWRAVVCGVGPVEAAITTARAIQEHAPAAILHIGIAGARTTRQLDLAALVIGSEARFCDLGVPEEWAPHRVEASPLLLAAVQRVLPKSPTLAIGTSARVGGSRLHDHRCDVEAMEGFGVLRAAQRAGVPAIEIRAISNDIEETDRARWAFQAAFDAIRGITPSLVHAIREQLHHA